MLQRIFWCLAMWITRCSGETSSNETSTQSSLADNIIVHLTESPVSDRLNLNFSDPSFFQSNIFAEPAAFPMFPPHHFAPPYFAHPPPPFLFAPPSPFSRFRHRKMHRFPIRHPMHNRKPLMSRTGFMKRYPPRFAHPRAIFGMIRKPFAFTNAGIPTPQPGGRVGENEIDTCDVGQRCQMIFSCFVRGGNPVKACGVGMLHFCCEHASEKVIRPPYYGPVKNDPYCGRGGNRVSRIVGGNDAEFGEFPWQTFIQVSGSRCGGALVGRQHVVTAGHCVARSKSNPGAIRVILGDFVLNSDIEELPHELFSVLQVRLHPDFQFTPQADRYDVAVLILDRPVEYKPNILPICLPPKDADFTGRLATVAGWGALEPGSKVRPRTLQNVQVPVVRNYVCEHWHRRQGINIRIHDEMICAGYEQGGRDSCQGDSGGPLMLNDHGTWYLIGIVSAGYSCAREYQPGIYHRVSASSDWISANVFS